VRNICSLDRSKCIPADLEDRSATSLLKASKNNFQFFFIRLCSIGPSFENLASAFPSDKRSGPALTNQWAGRAGSTPTAGNVDRAANRECPLAVDVMTMMMARR